MAFKLTNTPYEVDWTPIYRTGNKEGINGETFMNGSIVINKDINDPKQIENTVSHEKVHVNQIKDGRLTFNRDEAIWEGKRYKLNKGVSQKSQPWEDEAYAQETTIT